MLSDLVDTVMDMFGGRQNRPRVDNHDRQSGFQGMVDGLLEGEHPRQQRRRDAHDWDDEPDDPEMRRDRDRRLSFPDFD
jgi:hypothetical protein